MATVGFMEHSYHNLLLESHRNKDIKHECQDRKQYSTHRSVPYKFVHFTLLKGHICNISAEQIKTLSKHE